MSAVTFTPASNTGAQEQFGCSTRDRMWCAAANSFNTFYQLDTYTETACTVSTPIIHPDSRISTGICVVLNCVLLPMSHNRVRHDARSTRVLRSLVRVPMASIEGAWSDGCCAECFGNVKVGKRGCFLSSYNQTYCTYTPHTTHTHLHKHTTHTSTHTTHTHTHTDTTI